MSDDMIVPDFAALNRELKRQKHSERANKGWETKKAKRKPRGRPKLYEKILPVRIVKGVQPRIARALRPGESQSDFQRAAIERELQARGV